MVAASNDTPAFLAHATNEPTLRALISSLEFPMLTSSMKSAFSSTDRRVKQLITIVKVTDHDGLKSAFFLSE